MSLGFYCGNCAWYKIKLFVSKNVNFVNCVTGITISPKKNFCIIKIWMSDCNNQNPSIVTTDVKGLLPQGCIFKKHTPEY